MLFENTHILFLKIENDFLFYDYQTCIFALFYLFIYLFIFIFWRIETCFQKQLPNTFISFELWKTKTILNKKNTKISSN